MMVDRNGASPSLEPRLRTRSTAPSNASRHCLSLFGALAGVWSCGTSNDPAPSCPVVGASLSASSGPVTYSGLASGEYGSCVVGSDGQLYCWSHGDRGDPVP